MSEYRERFFDALPKGTTHEGTNLYNPAFLAVVEVRAKTGTFYHVLGTLEQWKKWESKNPIEKTKAIVASKRPTKMKAPDGHLLHVFGPGRKHNHYLREALTAEAEEVPLAPKKGKA